MIIKNYPEILKVKLVDVKEHPEKHRHTFDELMTCCNIEGCIDTMLLDAHEKCAFIGMNGDVPCDVIKGPCSCGAWH